MLFVCTMSQQAALLDIYLRGQKAYGDISAAAKEHSCIAEASKDMMPMCKKILLQPSHETGGEVAQKILALRLTNCYLEMAGMSLINCSMDSWKNTILGGFGSSKSKPMDRVIADCLRKIGEQNSGVAFQVFVQQLGRVFDICMYLDAKDFQRQSAEAAETLLKSSRDASTLLTSMLGTVQSNYEILEAYTQLLNTLSKNLTRIESTAREDQAHILQSLMEIRLNMQDGGKEFNDLILHATSLKEQIMNKVDYSITTLYSRLDTINDQLEILDDGTKQLADNVTVIAQRLEAVNNDTDALAQKLQHLSEAVDEGRLAIETSQEVGKDIMLNTRLAMESIEHQTRIQAKTLSNINRAVGTITNGLGSDGSSKQSWRRIGPLQLLWRLEKVAPGGILWYSALHICAQTLITLGASGGQAVSAKRVALLVVLLSYGTELLINTILNKTLTAVWIYCFAPFIALFGRIAEWFRIRRIRRFLAISCDGNEDCMQSYVSQIRIAPGMGFKEIFYGYMYGLWESDYAGVLDTSPFLDRSKCPDETHKCFLQYAYEITKFNISSGTISAIIRLVSSTGLVLYVLSAAFNVSQLGFLFENTQKNFEQETNIHNRLDAGSRKDHYVTEQSLRLSALESKRRTELLEQDHSLIAMKKRSGRSARKEYTAAHKKHSRASSVSL